MKLRTFRMGGVHPEENKISAEVKTVAAALPQQAVFPLDAACRDFLEKLMLRMGLSARACSRIIKLARTIADLESVQTYLEKASSGLEANSAPGQAPTTITNSPANINSTSASPLPFIEPLPISLMHLSEAATYRFLDRITPEPF